MEVAGQWRREWAGTAEYGKVTEGGVTRRVARAMEVLQASGPGARVRVMRAAYHSASAPGVPASSYMLHSSRRVISSGFNILESPTFPTQPLEISSMPLESSPESNIETEKYKVTEPDDMDISEPSKWRGTTGGNAIRMPSEESSSTDNASIIDLDSRYNRKGMYRKYSYDSENSDKHSLKRESARSSPLLDAPVTLNTLKFKSLLNSSNDWNNRRKSYSFEDTSPLNEIMVQSNDTLAMESSTDSGICKSYELVNDFTEDIHRKDFMGREKRYNIQHSIDNWQQINKSHSPYKTKMKTYKEHDTVIEDPNENNIALQSRGKLTITVPITIEGQDDDEYRKTNDDGDRRNKKVGFSKTELHFAAESGRVNIISTDEKPPPTNAFRKRRSAFVPIKDTFEKPITLFGEKSDFSEMNNINEFKLKDFSEITESEENTAATKSILKNKIPKPKPYLLGENMAFGNINDTVQSPDSPVSIGVSLINRELQTNSISSNRNTLFSSVNEAKTEKSFTDSLRTTSKGSALSPSSNVRKTESSNERYTTHTDPKEGNKKVKNKLHVLQMSPVPKPKSRQLRESDLTYFGIGKKQDCIVNNKNNHTGSNSPLPWLDSSENAFESVRLIKKYSNSAQNSDAESTDSPDYQNIPLKTNFAPVPIPRTRAKFMKPEEQGVVLKPIIEQVYDSNKAVHESHRSRTRRQDDLMTFASRSLSAPAKNHVRNNVDASHHRYDDIRINNNVKKETSKKREEEYIDKKASNNKVHDNIEDDDRLYANVEGRSSEIKEYNKRVKKEEHGGKSYKAKERKKSTNKSTDTESGSLEKPQISNKPNHRVRRTEKLCTPEKTNTLNNNKSKRLDNSISNSSNVKDNESNCRQKANRDTHISKCSKDNDQVKETKPESDHKPEYVAKEIQLPRANKRDKNSLEYQTRSKQSNIEKHSTDKVNNHTSGRRSTRRSEYVIKYDDKNGTVSSICKVRSGHSTPRKQHLSKERNKEYRKDNKSKNTDISALRNAAPCPSDSKRKK